MAAISNDWLEPLKPEFKKPYYINLYKNIKKNIVSMLSIHQQMKYLQPLS